MFGVNFKNQKSICVIQNNMTNKFGKTAAAGCENCHQPHDIHLTLCFDKTLTFGMH